MSCIDKRVQKTRTAACVYKLTFLQPRTAPENPLMPKRSSGSWKRHWFWICESSSQFLTTWSTNGKYPVVEGQKSAARRIYSLHELYNAPCPAKITATRVEHPHNYMSHRAKAAEDDDRARQAACQSPHDIARMGIVYALNRDRDATTAVHRADSVGLSGQSW